LIPSCPHHSTFESIIPGAAGQQIFGHLKREYFETGTQVIYFTYGSVQQSYLSKSASFVGTQLKRQIRSVHLLSFPMKDFRTRSRLSADFAGVFRGFDGIEQMIALAAP